MASQVAQKNLLGAQNALATSVERLSSGLRINRARDDAAGLSVANSLSSQINGANQGIRNLNDAISMVQTAEGAITAASDMGQRILTLATQAANSTLSTEARAAIKSEMQQLVSAIDSIGSRTKYAGNPLLDRKAAATGDHFAMQISNDTTDRVLLDKAGFRSIGLVGSADEKTDITLAELDVTGASNEILKVGQSREVWQSTTSNDVTTYTRKTLTREADTTGQTPATVYKLEGQAYTKAGDLSFTLGLVHGLSQKIDAAAGADTFDDVQDAASAYVTSLDKQRSLLGAYQNRLEFTLSNITALSTNLTASRSRVIDTDYASETADLTRNQILQQAATAMLAQANQMPNVILTLLK
jgi:flagellin